MDIKFLKDSLEKHAKNMLKLVVPPPGGQYPDRGTAPGRGAVSGRRDSPPDRGTAPPAGGLSPRWGTKRGDN